MRWGPKKAMDRAGALASQLSQKLASGGRGTHPETASAVRFTLGEQLDRLDYLFVDDRLEEVTLWIDSEHRHPHRVYRIQAGCRSTNAPSDDPVVALNTLSASQKHVGANREQVALRGSPACVLSPGLVRPQKPFLDQVIGLVRHAGKPERKAIHGVQVRQRLLLKLRLADEDDSLKNSSPP